MVGGVILHSDLELCDSPARYMYMLELYVRPWYMLQCYMYMLLVRARMGFKNIATAVLLASMTDYWYS